MFLKRLIFRFVKSFGWISAFDLSAFHEVCEDHCRWFKWAENGFCWSDGVKKVKHLMQSEILSVIERQSHYDYLGGVCLKINPV